ncbi:biotin--[acetyl-CoA-carboxylase] ligase [Sphingomonas carotinifaciens]|uniref:biotin--[acetyl-CoA-carboxylase] ligase n=1 Tax=Sphingomonas carotinifaciens TaxID=1166323 RepID=UPI001B860F8F|nr:biotin--[acetyl-CoA-carboxylase] ligase [Sphingomonas carotinifaciens]
MTRIVHVAETGSTNADLLALAKAGVEEGSWVRADRQTAGRGRQGRAWISPPGNFYASTLVRLRPGDPGASGLAFAAAVALEQVVRDLLSARDAEMLCLKWPNDLLLSGAKLSGILLERAEDALVIGIGVNLAHHPDLPDRATTSLAMHGVSVTPEAFLDRLAEAVGQWVSIWRNKGLEPVVDRWLARAHPVGAPITARMPDGAVVDGRFDGLARDGALRLRLADGAVRVMHAADIFLI